MNPTEVTKSRYSAPVGQVGGAMANGIITQDGTTPLTPRVSSEPISAGILGSTPRLSVPGTPISTVAQGLSGIADGVKQGAIASAEDLKVKEAEEAKKTSGNELKDVYEQIIGLQGSQVAAEEQAGLPQKGQALADATTRLEASQRAQTNELRAIDSDTRLTSEQAAARKREVNRQYAFEQADLALIQSAANRDFSTAQSILDRKIQLQLEPLKTRADYLKTFYDDNKENLTTAEARKFQVAQTKAQREYDAVKNFEDQKSSYALQALKDGNTNLFTALNNARSVNEVTKALVSNISSPFVTPNTSTDIQKAINVVIGSSKLTKEQKADFVNSVKNGEDPFIVVKNKAKDIMGQTLATDLSKAEVALDQIKTIDSLMKEFYKNGGDTGIFKGNLEKTLNKLGEVNDPNLVGVATKIALAMQSYRLAVTGTAASIQEDAKINDIFPGITKGEVLNNAKTQAVIESFQDKVDSGYRGTLGGVYDTLKNTSAQSSLDDTQARTSLQSFITRNPEKYTTEVLPRIKAIEKEWNRKATAREILEIYPEYSQQNAFIRTDK